MSSEPTKGTSSLAASTVNLTKSLVGIGLLTVPKVFADCSTLPAAITLLTFGALAALSFFMLGYCAHLTGASTLPQLWALTVGPGSAALVEIVILVDTSLACVAFVLLIGDYSTRSVSGLFPDLPEVLQSRNFYVGVITFGILLPLCMGRRLSLLRFSSIAGLLCTLYVFAYVVGDFTCNIFTVGLKTVSSRVSWLEARPTHLLTGTARFSVAFMSHFNAPSFYSDLCDRRPSRFALVCAVAFSAAILIYGVFGISGYGRFGETISSNALASYDLNTSVLLMWLGMGACVTASFPLVFAALRDALLALCSRGLGCNLNSGGRFAQVTTLTSVLVIARIGAGLEDLGIVISLLGSLSGAALSFIVPGAVMLNVKRRLTVKFTALGYFFVIVGIVLLISSFTAVVLVDILQWA